MSRTPKSNNISLPCLRGVIGDWNYYCTILTFKEVKKRVRLPREINQKYSDTKLKLDSWIQRKIVDRRINSIVDYLNLQEQRFFNSLILGIYEGKPSWQEIEIEPDRMYKEQVLDYLTKTFGVLTLEGNEAIFAIDGQHRAYGIRKALEKNNDLENDEVPVIIVAHNTTSEGHIRTRRLFSTLNRYAKPVSKSEIIALSEDDNCAILTRKMIADYRPFEDRILISKSKSISPKNRQYFTTIITLYEIIEKLFTNKRTPGVRSKYGYDNKYFTNIRLTDKELSAIFYILSDILNRLIAEVPSLSELFLDDKEIKRENLGTSLLFRPVGQNIIFNVLKASINENKIEDVYTFLKKDDFNMKNKIWKKVFWDEETEEISTNKTRQRFATLLILESLGFKIKRTKKDKEIYDNYGIEISDLH